MKRIFLLIALVLSPVSRPATATSADPNVPFVAAWDRFGQHADIEAKLSASVLISELSCVACHSSSDVSLQPKAGPKLDGAGTRLQREWVYDYLLNPSQHRHGTTMPDVLADLAKPEKQQAANALTAFLMAQQKPLKEIRGNGVNPVPLEFWKYGNAERGRELYHTTGCVACHEPDADYEVSEMKLSDNDRRLEQYDEEDLKELGLEAAARRVNSVPHPNLPRKYSVKSLTWFLMNPETVRPSGRMPNPGFRAVDAADVAQWLMERSNENRSLETVPIQTPDSSQLIQQGARLFQERGCSNCHTTPSAPRMAASSLQSVAASLKDSSTGASCLGDPQDRMPKYDLNYKQRETIHQGLSSWGSGLKQAQRLQLSMLQMNCYACHQRDSNGGIGRYRKAYFETVGQIDIGDEGRLPPPLTDIGAKLTTSHMKNVFRGRAKLRPFMTIQMPVYPDHMVSKLPGLFQKMDHPEPFPSDQQVFGDTRGLVEDGRRLMDAGCVQCHVFKGESLPGTVGIDLSGVTARVHPDWLARFLLNPGAVKRGTRMPTFFPNGKSQNNTILQGDTSRQISAIYAYLKALDQQPLPQKIADVRNQDFELRPTDQPIVFRTFMPVAGTHAIAVGYPAKVHAAFDAENLFWAEAWRGRFLDAQGTWYVRAAPPAVPLGDDRITLPAGPVVTRLQQVTENWPQKPDPQTDRFDGYRLQEGVPVLAYHLGNVAVQDRLDARKDGSFVRTLTLTSNGDTATGTVWLKAHQGQSLTRIGAGHFQDESGLKVKLEGLDLSGGQLVRQGTSSRWVLPVPLKQKTAVTVRLIYQW